MTTFKPVAVKTVQAIQWTSPTVVHPAIMNSCIQGNPSGGRALADSYYIVDCWGNRRYLTIGDWIVQEPDGVNCKLEKDSIFKLLYQTG